jgi:phage gpG-like protein
LKASISYNLDGLDKFALAVSKKYRVKLGILGNKDSRKEEGNSNATIGAVHEFGSFTKKIPRRSFLRLPLSLKSNRIIMALAKTTLKLLAIGNYKQIFVNLGIECEKIIQEAFETSGWGNWPPDKYKTIMAKTPMRLIKKLTKLGKKITGRPLIDTGQLRRSITSKVEAIH